MRLKETQLVILDDLVYGKCNEKSYKVYICG